ncbi:MAG: DNA polymerase I [Spirochaetes bacterium]|nr:DNA polymerase I [Spirochaetota bacterium]
MSHALCLIDGYSIVYRGYFAFLKKPLLNPQGRNSSSVFVFFRTLFQIVRARAPGYLAVAMDSRVPTFRHARYPAYKATREKAPEDLHAQVPVIEEILAALGVPCLQADGFEADDLIATLAEQCRAAGRPCWIFSGDKDILQLIGGNVRLLAQERGRSDIAEYSREKVFELRGVYPEQIVDFLALTGDASDNVPGVPGIGEKTAQKLLARYGSVDEIYARLDDVTPEGVRKKLVEGKESALLSRELVVLDRAVPGMPDVSALRFDGFRAEAAVPLFAREGMKRLVAELRGGGVEAAAVPTQEQAAVSTLASTAPGTYTTVTDLAELEGWLRRARAAGTFAFDTETDGTDEMRATPLGFSLSLEEGKACYIPIRAAGVACIPEAAVKQRLAGLLEDPAVKIVAQNAKFDYKVMRRWGVKPANLHFDTMVAAWVLDSDQGSYGLDGMAETRLAYRTMPYSELVPKGQTLADLPIQQVTDYSGEDADLTLRLYRVLEAELRAQGLAPLFSSVEMPLIEVLAEMELAGIRILSPRDLARIEEEVYALCGRKFNIASTKQLQEILFTWRKLTPVKKTKTGFSTDMDVLEVLAAQDPVPEKILAHRKLSKLKSTYVDALPLLVNEQTGRLHTHYVQTGTATGRLSSKDPNLQNIPIREEEGRRIRAAFVPAAGMRFVSADYAQIELAVMAYLSKDPMLLEAFREGRDIHRQTASLIFGVAEGEVTPDQRRVGKTINFGVIYGQTAYGLSQGLKIGKADAERFIRTYFQRYEGVDRFLKETIRRAEETGYVQTLLGRRRKVNAIRSQNKTEKSAAERVAVNSPIQGTAADLVKLAMTALYTRLKREGLASRILLQVHDEIILESPEEEAQAVAGIVREVMERVTEHAIPLKVQCEIGDSWGAFH